MSDWAAQLPARAPGRPAPYFLEVATYGPHAQMHAGLPRQPARSRRRSPTGRPTGDPTGGNCGTEGVRATHAARPQGVRRPARRQRPHLPAPRRDHAPAPAWNTNPVTLTRPRALTRYRDRARMVQSIDRMVGRLRAAAGPNTYFFLTSDNGFHLGQHQLNGGKGTPYDSDTHVPLVVVGPDVAPGPRRQFVSSIDLAPTFETLAGLRPPPYRSGTSLRRQPARRRAPEVAGTCSSSTPTPAPSPGRSTATRAPAATIEHRSRRTSRCAASAVCWRGSTSTTPGAGTDYAWELYRYDVPWEDRNVFAERPRQAAGLAT